ncbi:Abscisic acid G-protein coupled receptor [Novymonas esmeraldas]|uniref:Abscisic acid G-protein coupled receptor n=1 Tax=Novymonas esmeraldas TaxID=1808958 RepID=A0AAW0EMQ6_9TRYP
MDVLYVTASCAFFFYVGELLMRLVVVQSASDASAARWCFASTFALSMSLFSAVLADMADASLFSSSSAAANGASPSRVSTLLRLTRPLVRVNAQTFTWLLLGLLTTVLVVCPTVFAVSCVRYTFSRGKQSRGGVAASRATQQRRGSSRRSSVGRGAFVGLGAASRRDGSRAGSEPRQPFDLNVDDGKRRRRTCVPLRWVLACLLLVSLIAAGLWVTGATPRWDVATARERSIMTARRVYEQVQSRAAVLRIPREIRSSGGAASVEPEAEPTQQAADGVAGGVAEIGGTAGEQPTPPLQSPKSRFSLAGTVPSVPALMSDLHMFVCAITSRVATVGVAMIGLLSGYAAITSPCLFLAPYTYWRGREDELRRAQQNFNKKLCYVLSGCGATQRRIASLQYGVLHEEWASPAFSANTPSPHRAVEDAPSSYRDSPYPHAGNGSGAADPWQAHGCAHPSSSPAPQSRPLPLPQQQQQLQRSPHAAASAQPAASGAVDWIHKKLSTAAHVVVGGAAAMNADGSGGRVSPKSPTSAMSSPAMSRHRAVARIVALRAESAASRFLGLSLYLQLHEVEGMLREARRGATWVGRWYASLGVGMALYSVVKVGLTVASLWLFRSSTQDPVTRAVTLLESAFILRRSDSHGGGGGGHHSFSVTAVEVSAHAILALALVMNAWMVLNAIRGALLALFYLTMSFSGSAIGRPETVAVGLSMMVGLYFLGQLVLLRASLPGAASAAPADGADAAANNVLLAVLGSLPYYYYQRLSDWCFLAGCCGAVVVRGVVLRDTVASVVRTASGGE